MYAKSKTEEEMNTNDQSSIKTGLAEVIIESPIGLSTGYGDNPFTSLTTKNQNLLMRSISYFSSTTKTIVE
jgi:hypothetical protein